jgi:hypothetical protein
MEAVVQQAIIALISGVVLFALGFLANSITGKNRAEVRGIIAQAKKNEADSDSDYAQLARDGARDLRLLREEYEKDKRERDAREFRLTQRVEVLEHENAEKDKQILALKIENSELRTKLDRGKGLEMK